MSPKKKLTALPVPLPECRKPLPEPVLPGLFEATMMLVTGPFIAALAIFGVSVLVQSCLLLDSIVRPLIEGRP